MLKCAILYALPPLYMAMGRGVPMSLTAFLLSIMAGVIANCISKWLDERDDGDEPRDQAHLQYGNRKAPKMLAWGLFVCRLSH